MFHKIKLKNVCIDFMCRNEKRRIEGTGEAPTWQYYHEVDELLGSHHDHSLDMSNLDESNIANSSSISKFHLFNSFMEPFLGYFSTSNFSPFFNSIYFRL